MSKEIQKPTIQQVQSGYQELYNTLNKAYWVATTIEAKDKIHGMAEVVFDVLTDLNRADLTSRTDEYVEITKKVTQVNTKLDDLKKEIDKYIEAVELAVRVTKAIDKALDTAAEYFTEIV